MTTVRPLALVPGAVLAGAAGLHVAWGLGSSFPYDDRSSLADAVAGTPEVPSRGPCFVVAAGLAAGAALVVGVGGKQRLATMARMALAASLGLRGLTGVTGMTEMLVPWSPSDRFRELDRRRYGPLCLSLSAAITICALPA
jgi:hypothetical protein